MFSTYLAAFLLSLAFRAALLQEPTTPQVTTEKPCGTPCIVGNTTCGLLQSCINGCCGPAVINNMPNPEPNDTPINDTVNPPIV